MNKLLSFIKRDKAYIVYAIALFTLFCVTVSLSPLCGDDWFWGSELGKAELDKWFDNYNGRYSGNLLVLVLTRSMVLRSIFLPLSLTVLCFLPLLFAKKRSLMLLSLSSLLIWSMSQRMLVQGIFWTSGFVNYFPPMILTYIYFILVDDVFEKAPRERSLKRVATLSASSLIIGIVSTMFMENVSIYVIAASIGIIAIAYIKFKKIFIPHLCHLFGGIIGIICMFSNSVYSTIASGNDAYRTSPLHQENLGSTMAYHSRECVQLMLSEGAILTVTVSVICIIATVFKIREGNKRVYIPLIISTALNCICADIMLLKPYEKAWEHIHRIFKNSAIPMDISAIIYCITTVIALFVCIRDKEKILKMLFVLAGVPVLVAPLLIITPFGPRCTIPPYICLVFFTVMLFDGMWEYFGFKVRATHVLTVAFSLLAVAIASYYIAIHIPMKKYEAKRTEYVEKQISMGCETVVVPNLPHLELMQHGDLTHGYWVYCYKKYYNIDDNISLKVLTPEDFDKWIEEFENGGK